MVTLPNNVGYKFRKQKGPKHKSDAVGIKHYGLALKLIRNGFTKRQAECAALLTEGLPNIEIANQLCISKQGVKNHFTAIFIKLGVKNRLKAILKMSTL